MVFRLTCGPTAIIMLLYAAVQSVGWSQNRKSKIIVNDNNLMVTFLLKLK